MVQKTRSIQKQQTVDLNADLGEGMQTDAELMALISSANISCGAHAGDSETIHEALLLTKKHRVAVGAHIGYADRNNFGRTEFELTDSFIESTIRSCELQLIGFIGFAKKRGIRVRYVKPHGALYNQAFREPKLGLSIAKLCRSFGLPILGLSGSYLQKKINASKEFIPEGFADRAYRSDGTLVPRSEPNAVLHDISRIVSQVVWLINKKKIRSICIHGDTPNAVKFSQAIREAILAEGLKIKRFTT
jgi:5-oxoprolinase (ATP-hydrolysing) subunit A